MPSNGSISTAISHPSRVKKTAKPNDLCEKNTRKMMDLDPWWLYVYWNKTGIAKTNMGILYMDSLMIEKAVL